MSIFFIFKKRKTTVYKNKGYAFSDIYLVEFRGGAKNDEVIKSYMQSIKTRVLLYGL